MTDYVHLPNSTFDHGRLHLAPPNGLQGGSYFSMMYYKDAPLYIQTPICTSRQGVTPGKRPYIDLMFSSHDVPFLEWLEALEANAVRLIYEKRNLWISSDIEKSDIEAGFTSPIRPYKGGKYYLIRSHIQTVKHLATGAASSCSVFDENERPVPMEYIKPEHQMYAVLEFQGIKFSARSFQMEVTLKQVLIVPNVPLFQSCVIRRPSHPPNDATAASSTANDATATSSITNDTITTTANDATSSITNDDIITTTNDAIITPINDTTSLITNDDIITTTNDAIITSINDATTTTINDATNTTINDAITTPINDGTASTANDAITTNDATTCNEQPQPHPQSHHLQEVDFDVLEELEHIQLKLKKPTQVYYEMYRMAKQKAKELKKHAIAAYLEAKQIKSTHMLEDSSDSNEEDEDEDEDQG